MKDSTTNYLFDLCVLALEKSAAILGITYKEINVWIFCIIGPITFTVITALLIHQSRLTKKYKGMVETT